MTCRKRIVESTFPSVLDYGDVIYRHAAASTLGPLDSVYHLALRVITGDTLLTTVSSIKRLVGLLSMRHAVIISVCKALVGKLPSYITVALEPRFTFSARATGWFFVYPVPGLVLEDLLLELVQQTHGIS